MLPRQLAGESENRLVRREPNDVGGATVLAVKCCPALPECRLEPQACRKLSHSICNLPSRVAEADRTILVAGSVGVEKTSEERSTLLGRCTQVYCRDVLVSENTQIGKPAAKPEYGVRRAAGRCVWLADIEPIFLDELADLRLWIGDASRRGRSVTKPSAKRVRRNKKIDMWQSERSANLDGMIAPTMRRPQRRLDLFCCEPLRCYASSAAVPCPTRRSSPCPPQVLPAGCNHRAIIEDHIVARLSVLNGAYPGNTINAAVHAKNLIADRQLTHRCEAVRGWDRRVQRQRFAHLVAAAARHSEMFGRRAEQLLLPLPRLYAKRQPRELDGIS